MKFRQFCAGTAVVLCAMMSNAASATILVDQADPLSGYHLGGGDFANFEAKLAAQPGGYVVGSIANAAQVNAASAILVILRQDSHLALDETVNLATFIASGKRVFLMGENIYWPWWNNDILALASGGTSSFAGPYNGPVTPVVTHELTDGLASLYINAGGVNTGGGTQLFNQNVATLWGAGNVVTFLDSYAFTQNGNSKFQQNVANWLAAGGASGAVPEPASWATMIAGFAVVGGMMRRRVISARFA
jgi:hypothetical protein